MAVGGGGWGVLHPAAPDSQGTPMATVHVPVCERLSTTWAPRDDGRYDVAITEHRATRDRTTRYVAERGEVFGGSEQWLWQKPDHEPTDADDGFRQTWVNPDGTGWCSCKGAVCRGQRITCRHLVAINQGREQGAI